MKHATTHKAQGFTLLETLISISIIAGIGMLIAQVFFTTTRTNTKTELLKDVKQNGDYAMGVIARQIRNATHIEEAASECPTSDPPTLTSIDIRNPDGNITTLGCVFDATNSVTRIASTSASSLSSEYLTSQNLTLGGAACDEASMTLGFTCTAFPDQSPTIMVSFQLIQKGTPVDQFEKGSILFQTTVTPRF